ncbi:MAG: DUF5060 domain-containing protein [Chitinivibrionales bacterium]
MFKKNVALTAVLVLFSALTLLAATIGTVTPSPASVAKYAKLELNVALGSTYSNPYDPTVIDLSATFTSPSGKAWKVNGFYNGTQYLIRFAANETGNWTYVVSATDASGTATSPSGTFSVTTSAYHGWIKNAPNNRYLMYDDGTSFYGVGMAYCWSVTQAGLTALQNAKCNTWVYWNGTYDGYNLIESPSSGIGKYDQAKCGRIDNLISWSETANLGMILVIWPHDYLGQNMTGSWENQWSQNAYSSLGNASVFYSDATMWSHQQNLYRYMIARWGYSRALLSWQTVDEIGGTDGWSNQTTANAWTVKIANLFATTDPFKHPTNASQGSYWAAGNAANTWSNTENYGSQTASSWASLVQQEWNGAAKPAMSGEAAGSGCNATSLFATMASGACINPMWWQYNQGTNTSADMTAESNFATFVNGINFAGFSNLSKATVTGGGSTAYGIKGDQGAFGWISGAASGSLSIAGMANGTYAVTFFNCGTGADISTSNVTVSGGSLTATIPSNSASSVAFKALNPNAVQVVEQTASRETQIRPMVSYENGALHLLGPIAANSVVDITTALGATIARYKVTDANANTVRINRLGQGIYFVGITSGNAKTMQRLFVK